jgi:hypothetical protein
MDISAPAPWIISKNQDLAFFFGGAIVGYAIIGLMAIGFPIWPFFVSMLLVFEGPHVFATATRTYFNPEARRKLGWTLWLIVPFFFIGPIMHLIGLGTIFTVLAFTCVHFHIAKQHLGFVFLYKRKVGDKSDISIDRRFLLASLMIPVLNYWVIASPLFSELGGAPNFRLAICVAYGLFAVWYTRRQIVREGASLLGLGLMSVIIPLQWLAFYYAPKSGYGFLAAGVPIAIGHAIQYHRLIWFHNRNRYIDKSAGLSGLLSHRLLYHVVAILTLNFCIYIIPRTLMIDIPAAVSCLWGLSFMHFVLDGEIWKVRGNPDLAAALKI